MLTFAQLFLEFIEFVWPFHRVSEWQHGVVLRFGRYWKTVGPGVYLYPWWFITVHPVDTVPDTPSVPGTETITTKDDGTVTFCPLFELEVVDARLAFCSVMEHAEKARRDAWGITADVLAELPAGRLEPEARSRMVTTCVRRINDRLETYGMRCNSLTFTTFMRNIKNYRLMTGP